jgi:hypothetical protein
MFNHALVLPCCTVNNPFCLSAQGRAGQGRQAAFWKSLKLAYISKVLKLLT